MSNNSVTLHPEIVDTAGELTRVNEKLINRATMKSKLNHQLIGATRNRGEQEKWLK